MPRRRLEDRIQDLVRQAVTAREGEELTEIIRRLRAELREHTARLRKLAADKLAKPKTRRAPAVVKITTVTPDIAIADAELARTKQEPNRARLDQI